MTIAWPCEKWQTFSRPVGHFGHPPASFRVKPLFNGVLFLISYLKKHFKPFFHFTGFKRYFSALRICEFLVSFFWCYEQVDNTQYLTVFSMPISPSWMVTFLFNSLSTNGDMPFEDAETLRKQKNSNEDIEQINIFVLNQDQFLLLLYHRFMEILKKIKMSSFPVNIRL